MLIVRISVIARIMAPLLLMALLCSCDTQFFGGDRQLMRPPYPAGEDRSIQEELTKSLGSFTLKYPKTGSYRSAIVRKDLTGDGRDDALVFYRQDETKPISFALLSQDKGKWQFVSKKEGEGGEIDRVLCIPPNEGKGAPCGACRELMVQLMPGKYKDIDVMIDYSKDRVMKLGELTPEWWID